MNNPLSFIITENNPEKARLMARELENRGFRVTVCPKNGAKLLSVYNEINADGIIMDVVLSHIDSFGVVSRINELNPADHPLIVVLSDFDNPNFQKAFARLGVDYYFLKPVEASIVAERVVQIASWRGFKNDVGVVSSGNLFQDVSSLLLEIGVSPTNKGYNYIFEAVTICVKNPSAVNNFTDSVYGIIAQHNNTTIKAVERSIRYSISTLNAEIRQSNSCFISSLAENLRHRYFYVK